LGLEHLLLVGNNTVALVFDLHHLQLRMAWRKKLRRE